MLNTHQGKKMKKQKRNTQCKYCGDTIRFSDICKTPINANSGTRHICDGYSAARNVRLITRDRLTKEEIAQYERAVNA